MKIINILFPLVGCLLGFLIAFNFKPKDTKLILAFSGAFLISLIVSDVLPVLYVNELFSPGPWIMGGILLQIILEFFSKGAEHGHSHSEISRNQSILIIISLCLHAFIEGIPLVKFETLSWGIFFHKIPVSMVVYLLFRKELNFNGFNLLYLGLFCLATPIGVFISYTNPIIDKILYPLTALVVGMLLHIGTTILFESSEGHKFNTQKMVSIIIAILIVAII